MAEDAKPESGTDKEPDESKTTEPDHQAEADKWKALSRKHEADAKKNADAAKRLAELEEKDKTEQQKLTDAKLAAEKRAEEAELKALRFEVASEKGLTTSQALRLVGSDKDELLADADELISSFKPSSDKEDDPKKPGTKKPTPNLKGGLDPEEEADPEVGDILKSIPR